MSPPRVECRKTVRLGDAAVEYELYRSPRRTLGITVTYRGELRVTAPTPATAEQIERVLLRRQAWILRQMRETAALPAEMPEKEWVSGESHWYLGRQYRLRVRAAGVAGVRLMGRYFEVGIADPSDRRKVREVMARWYLTRARDVCQRRMRHIADTIPSLALDSPPPLIVRSIRLRWGSCSPGGRILMNVDAVKLPVGCIDYLLVHELCHLRHPRHDRAFWRYLGRCMPDWASRQRKLARFTA
jgi:predicted metal-dependent hydrolase